MSQSEAQAFLSDFAAVATPSPPVSQNVKTPQRGTRKLRPVKLQAGETDSQSSPPTAFANAHTEPVSDSPFLRHLPQQQVQTDKQISDPFLRPLPPNPDLTDNQQSNGQLPGYAPTRQKRKSRWFARLAHFKASSSKNDAQTSSLNQKLPEISSLAIDNYTVAPQLAKSDIRNLVARHVTHLRTVCSDPNQFFRAVKALLSCFHSSAKGESVLLWPNCRPAQAAKYCRDVLRQIIPFFRDYPAPVINAFKQILSDADLPIQESSFPAATGVWIPRLAGSSTSLLTSQPEPESVSRRLSGNLETAWDHVLRLQRMYRGDISSCAPGTLDVNAALHAMALLHPANMDVFAARLLKLVSDTRLHSRDAPARMRQLGERLHDAPPRRHDKKGNKGPGVVLHRLPELVRSMFEDDPAQLFFLDFLTGVDSAKLNTALVPRLVTGIARALETAGSAITNVAFTDAVLDARIYSKLLSVTMHSSNWAHSAFSLSGMDDKDSQVNPGLGVHALQRRVPIHTALFRTAIDIEDVILDAIASEHVLPVIASVTVADVIIRLAAVDPVARVSEWYKRGIHALRSVRVCSTDGECMPLLHTVVCSLLESEACREDSPFEVADDVFVLRCDNEVWPDIGDTRLLRVLCPLLDDLRKSVHIHDTGSKATVRRITPQVAPKVASTLLKKDTEADMGERKRSAEGDVQAALRREFYARMDGRLRELVRVVASANPVNGSVAKENYCKIVEMLYPDTTKSVIAVAANLCEFEVGLIERESQKEKSKGDKAKEQQKVDTKGIEIKEIT